MSRILIALGGNALGDNPQEQLRIVKKTAKSIVDLVEEGHEVVVTHGNGPQVGMINLAMENVSMGLPECTAMSQGYIGYHLQNSIYEELRKRGIKKDVGSLITQVIVDENDKAFENPTKPIGRFYNEEEAKELKKKGYKVVEDSGRGYRRVVPSPKPVDIVEKRLMATLLNEGYILIVGGGGGIPVIRKDFGFQGIDCVVDKDLVGEKIGELVDADYLLILTAVDKVSINFGKPDQIDLDEMSKEDVDRYIEENQFAPGSMLPKIVAGVEFVKSKEGRKTIIASLNKVEGILTGKNGTTIY